MLQAWAGYSEFSVTSSVTGTAVVPTTSAQRLLFNADNTGAAMTFNAGAVPTGSTATLTYLQGTAPAISQMGHGYGTLFARLRLPVPGVKIKLEFTIDNGSTWILGHASAVAHATVGGGTMFIGNEMSLTGNPNGFRITIDFSGCAANAALYLIEAGIHHEAFQLGMHSFAKTYAVNTFRGKQTFKDGIQVVPGAATGKVWICTDDQGNGAWGNAASGDAPLNSPAFTGNPTAPTPATADNDTSIATTAFVKAAIAADKPSPITVSGPRSQGTTFAALLAALDTLGLIVDNTTGPDTDGIILLPTGTNPPAGLPNDTMVAYY
jgi:hypothetical protein